MVIVRVLHPDPERFSCITMTYQYLHVSYEVGRTQSGRYGYCQGPPPISMKVQLYYHDISIFTCFLCSKSTKSGRYGYCQGPPPRSRKIQLYYHDISIFTCFLCSRKYSD